MTEPTDEELAEALRSIEGLPLGTRLIVRLAADRLCPRAEEYDFGDDPDKDPWVGEDGWIEWDGSGYSDNKDWLAPVPVGTILDVRYRDGKTLINIPAGETNLDTRLACGAYWKNEGAENDIIAYKIVGAP